jgi:ABC-type uncharacterized transport system ATPase subunit
MSPPSSDTPVVQTRGLVKRYGDLVAVDSVDLTVPAGDVYGLLGPNGAGKTTFMRMLFGLIRPDAGSVELFGREAVAGKVDTLRDVAGFVETPRFYGYLSGRANLEILAELDRRDGNGRIDEVFEQVDLRERADDKVREYSYGMVQRLGVAAALMRSPRLLVLDEPTTAWTRRGSATCASSCAGSPTRASRSCCRATTCWKSRRCAGTWRSCAAAGWPSPGRCRSCARAPRRCSTGW